MRRLLPASRRWYPFVVSATLASLVACGGGGGDGGGGGTPPPTGGNNTTPASVTAVQGASGQQATVGTAVATAPSVRVANSAGTPLPNVGVTFAVTAGGGTLGATTAQTNAQGIASAGSWTLGSVAGTQTITATVGSLSTTISATATAGPAAQIVGVNAANLEGSAGDPLPASITVKVTDAANNPVAGASVAFAPTAGSGSVNAATATTNANGEAQTAWTLGADAGTDQLVATVAGTSVSTTISASAVITTLVASRVDVGGRAFKCVVRPAGAVACWGENAAGNLGDGTQTFRARPVNVSLAGVTFTDVSLGTFHGCGLAAGGAAYCWGRNNTGVVGDGTTTDRTTPVAVTGGRTFASLAVGASYSCALGADGSVWCWGQPSGAAVRAAPTQLNAGGRTITALAVTNTQVCGAVSTGGVMCWTGDIFAAAAPAVTSAELTFTALAGGGAHQCGVIADGRAYCWGFNAAGQLGNNDPMLANQAAPTLVSGPYRYNAISAGENHTCAIGTDGTSYCWGNNISGQLGVNVLPTVEPARAYPSAVAAPSGVQFQRIAAGGNGSCAIAAGSSQVYCWGARAFDNAGQFVNADAAPVAVRDR